MRIIKRKLIWADINVKKNSLTPTYYFYFDLLNQIGFSDNEMLGFLDEMKIYAEKEMRERSEAKNEKKIVGEEQKEEFKSGSYHETLQPPESAA